MDEPGSEPAAPASRVPSEEEVRLLAAAAGLALAPGRRSVVAAHLAELRAFAAELRAVDLAEMGPEASFDPRWPEEESA